MRKQSILSLRAVVVALTLVAFVAGTALADGSVSSLRMGMGARDAAAFQRFENVIQ